MIKGKQFRSGTETGVELVNRRVKGSVNWILFNVVDWWKYVSSSRSAYSKKEPILEAFPQLGFICGQFDKTGHSAKLFVLLRNSDK
jgi:hypothetical protein